MENKKLKIKDKYYEYTYENNTLKLLVNANLVGFLDFLFLYFLKKCFKPKKLYIDYLIDNDWDREFFEVYLVDIDVPNSLLQTIKGNS